MKKSAKINRALTDFIAQHMDGVYFAVVAVISVLIRYKFFKLESPDMVSYLQTWMSTIAQKGGFVSLREPIGNYNIPYMVFLTFVSSVTDDRIVRMMAVKLFSTFFDCLLAGFVYFVLRRNGHGQKALLGASAVLLNPIILLNSAFWGQCDIIYATFLVMSLYFCLKERWTLSFLLFGAAFAFKLQAIFFAPVLILCWIIKRFHFLYFFLALIPNLVLSLPAIFAGRPVKEVLLIYSEQVGAFPEMVKNYPGVYFIFRSSYRNLFWPAILFTVFIICSGGYYYFRRNMHSKKNMIAMTIWLIWTCVMFLPAMHERYGMAVEVLLILYVLVYKEFFEVCAGVYFCTLCVYSSYLFGSEPWDKKYTAVINLVLYLYFTYRLFKEYRKRMDLSAGAETYGVES